MSAAQNLAFPVAAQAIGLGEAVQMLLKPASSETHMPPEQLASWLDWLLLVRCLDEAVARDWVLGGGSLMLAGLPGTGKSHLLQEWLREMDRRKIYLTAPTHVAARNLRVEPGEAGAYDALQVLEPLPEAGGEAAQGLYSGDR